MSDKISVRLSSEKWKKSSSSTATEQPQYEDKRNLVFLFAGALLPF